MYLCVASLFDILASSILQLHSGCMISEELAAQNVKRMESINHGISGPFFYISFDTVH